MEIYILSDPSFLTPQFSNYFFPLYFLSIFFFSYLLTSTPHPSPNPQHKHKDKDIRPDGAKHVPVSTRHFQVSCPRGWHEREECCYDVRYTSTTTTASAATAVASAACGSRRRRVDAFFAAEKEATGLKGEFEGEED